MSRPTMPWRILPVVAFSFLTASILYSQQSVVSLRTQLLADEFSPAFRDTVSQGTEERSSRSPAVATILSALAPGAGQIYAQRYWTLPLVWGFGYWFVRNYIQLDRKYDEWSVRYSESLTQGVFAGSGDPQVKYIRDFYRDERDRFAFYVAITYVLNIVDAYVGASLYNFDVSEDLEGSKNIRMELRIPVR